MDYNGYVLVCSLVLSDCLSYLVVPLLIFRMLWLNHKHTRTEEKTLAFGACKGEIKMNDATDLQQQQIGSDEQTHRTGSSL